MYLSQGLEDHKTARISFLTLDWIFSKFTRHDFRPFESLPQKPSGLDKMIEYARLLSKDVPFVRVDFYEIDRCIYFGELTFSPGGGFTPFGDEDQDVELGEFLQLC